MEKVNFSPFAIVIPSPTINTQQLIDPVLRLISLQWHDLSNHLRPPPPQTPSICISQVKMANREEALRLCISLARESLEAGDSPFGSVLVDASGAIVFQDRNRTVTGEAGDFKADATLHPELTLARWAHRNLTPEARASAVVYTSGEHCAMCAAAHAYVGLGRIVYISSTEQYQSWMEEANVRKGAVAPLPINAVAPHVEVEGPIPGLDLEVKALHEQRWRQRKLEAEASSTKD
ncbi:cytidine deaminase-like protein [Trichoderma chlorosporum]